MVFPSLQNGKSSLSFMRKNGSNGLPGAKTEITQRDKHEISRTKAAKPVLCRPIHLRQYGNRKVPKTPTNAAAASRMDTKDSLRPCSFA